MSGLMVEFFASKCSVLLVNIHFLVGYILYHFANCVLILYVSKGLGIRIGFMEAPVMTYIAETC
jgi:hypothetical protein